MLLSDERFFLASHGVLWFGADSLDHYVEQSVYSGRLCRPFKELAVKVLKSLKGLVKEFFTQIDIISRKNIMALVWFCMVLHGSASGNCFFVCYSF
jgi:hypothetical protein